MTTGSSVVEVRPGDPSDHGLPGRPQKAAVAAPVGTTTVICPESFGSGVKGR